MFVLFDVCLFVFVEDRNVSWEARFASTVRHGAPCICGGQAHILTEWFDSPITWKCKDGINVKQL